MVYYINICSLGGNENICYDIDCCRLTFWNKDILITENFYKELLKERNVMLIPEMHKDENLIPDMEHYFQKTIDFTIVDEKLTSNRKVLTCKLNAYFVGSDEAF